MAMNHPSAFDCGSYRLACGQVVSDFVARPCSIGGRAFVHRCALSIAAPQARRFRRSLPAQASRRLDALQHTPLAVGNGSDGYGVTFTAVVYKNRHTLWSFSITGPVLKRFNASEGTGRVRPLYPCCAPTQWYCRRLPFPTSTFGRYCVDRASQCAFHRIFPVCVFW